MKAEVDALGTTTVIDIKVVVVVEVVGKLAQREDRRAVEVVEKEKKFINMCSY